MRWTHQAAGCLTILFLATCAHDSERQAPESRESAPQPVAPRVAAVPYEQIGDIEDVSRSERHREVVLRIVIAVGHTQEQVHATLQEVAEETARKLDADGVLVFAYRSVDDVRGPYNVARAAYDRDWERGSFEPGPFVVDLDPSYLKPEQAPSAPGGHVSSGVTVARESYGDKWPFPKHASAILDCETRVFRGTLRPFDIVELDGVRYGFNRTAVEVGGFPDAWRFIADSYPPEHPESALLDIRMKMEEACRAKRHPTLP